MGHSKSHSNTKTHSSLAQYIDICIAFFRTNQLRRANKFIFWRVLLAELDYFRETLSEKDYRGKELWARLVLSRSLKFQTWKEEDG